MDNLKVFMLAQIILLSTDQAQVEHTSKVTRVQDQFLTMLHRYLKHKHHQGANSKLAKGIMISSLAREAQEIRSHRLPV